MTMILAYPLAALLTAAIIGVTRRLRSDLAQDIKDSLAGPIRILLWVLMVRFVLGTFVRSFMVDVLMEASTLLVIAVAWLAVRLVDFVVSRMIRRPGTRWMGSPLALLQHGARAIKLVVMVGAILFWLDNIGLQVTALLAGLSIGGIAIALASQKTLENIFGAVMLFSSQPVRVGDVCQFGDVVGTVEDIGLRATRIRTLDRTVVSVPNAEFVNLHLNNYSERDRFWFHPTIQLRYETTPDQLRCVLTEMRGMFHAHPNIAPDPLRVRFTGFGEYALNIEVFAYIERVTDYAESLAVAEDLNLRLMDIVAAAGTELAFPSQVSYQIPGKRLDQESIRAAEAKVKEWRSRQAFYFPDFPIDKIGELRSTLDYPPAGSPNYSPSPNTP